MNPVLILCHNNFDQITKRCIESVLKQDVEIELYLVDNGSTDNTTDYILDSGHRFILLDRNYGVSYGWNLGLNLVFKEHKHCLVIGSDTVLAPWTYQCLLDYEVPFVSGVAVDNMDQIKDYPAGAGILSPNPDFSCFLIRREVWREIGEFDEVFVNYCGDTDYHIRAHQAEIPLFKAPIPFYHERSSTIGLALEPERSQLHARANLDREAHKAKWGTIPGTEEYYKLFS